MAKKASSKPEKNKRPEFETVHGESCRIDYGLSPSVRPIRRDIDLSLRQKAMLEKAREKQRQAAILEKAKEEKKDSEE